MASLPKIRRTRVARRSIAPPQPERTTADVQRLEAFGLTWLNIESPERRRCTVAGCQLRLS